MKNRKFFVTGMLALALTFVLVLPGCSMSGDDGGGSPPPEMRYLNFTMDSKDFVIMQTGPVTGGTFVFSIKTAGTENYENVTSGSYTQENGSTQFKNSSNALVLTFDGNKITVVSNLTLPGNGGTITASTESSGTVQIATTVYETLAGHRGTWVKEKTGGGYVALVIRATQLTIIDESESPFENTYPVRDIWNYNNSSSMSYGFSSYRIYCELDNNGNLVIPDKSGPGKLHGTWALAGGGGGSGGVPPEDHKGTWKKGSITLTIETTQLTVSGANWSEANGTFPIGSVSDDSGPGPVHYYYGNKFGINCGLDNSGNLVIVPGSGPGELHGIWSR